MSYETGYKKPPRRAAFQKGVSGNPAGKVKRTASEDPMEAAWNAVVRVPVKSQRRRMTVRKLAVLEKVPRCIKGDLDAIEALFALRREGGQKPAPRAPKVIIERVKD